MAYDRFMIAPYNSGLINAVKPFAIPDEAFTSCNNAYVWRGRVKKRCGATVMNQNLAINEQQMGTRLRIFLGQTDGAGAFPAGNVPGRFPLFFAGQMFSINAGLLHTYYTVQNGLGPTPMLSTTPGATGTFDNATGAYTFANALHNANVYYYPSIPVMNFFIYEQADINDNYTLAFDQEFAYRYSGLGWERIGVGGAGAVASDGYWRGNDHDNFFSGTSWHGFTDNSNYFYVVNNYNPGLNTISDGIQYWDGAAWHTIRPFIYNSVAPDPLNHTFTLETAKILVTFKNRIIALNVTIGDTNTTGAPGNITYTTYVNRAFCSRNGDPSSAAESWRIDIPGRGYYIDAPTKQPIVAASIIHDRLIVYFSSSTYELVYTGNEVYPFVWQQISAELGAQSTNSVINFDNEVIAIGTTGIHSCNGNSVQRIDNQIPNDVFQVFATAEGTARACGIRDFANEMVYWSIPYNPNIVFNNSTWPNKLLVYNYKSPSYAYFDDSVTAFGYYERQGETTWEQMHQTWEEADMAWNALEVQNHPKQVVAGNQQGWTFIVQSNENSNDISLYIAGLNPVTYLLTVPNHNLPMYSYVYISNCVGITELNDQIFQVQAMDKDTLFVFTPIVLSAGPYLGGGTITLVSQISFKTKPFNFYIDKNRNTSINKIDFLVSNSANGEIAVECYPSYSNIELYQQSVLSGCQFGTGVLELHPYNNVDHAMEAAQDMMWHPLYFQVEGESLQFELFYNVAQLTDPRKAFAGFELNAVSIYATPTSYHTR